jgi:hypothetical protein
MFEKINANSGKYNECGLKCLKKINVRAGKYQEFGLKVTKLG